MARDAKVNKKGFYSYLNQERKVQEGIPCLVSDTDKLVTTDKKVAEVLYSTFASIFSKARDHSRNLIIH